MIIAHLMSQTDLWSKIVSPPVLVSKGNVMIGYNPIYEYAALPDVERIVSALRRSGETKRQRRAVVGGHESGRDERAIAEPRSTPAAEAPPRAAGRKHMITVL